MGRDADVEWLLRSLPLLAFAACPLMMVFCAFGMRKSGCSAGGVPETSSAVSVEEVSPAAGIAALRSRLGRLQAEQVTLAQQIDALVAEARDEAPVEDETAAVPISAIY